MFQYLKDRSALALLLKKILILAILAGFIALGFYWYGWRQMMVCLGCFFAGGIAPVLWRNLVDDGYRWW